MAACPPVKASIPRTPGPYRIMVIGGHPDDADIICGCTAAKLIAKGCRVQFALGDVECWLRCGRGLVGVDGCQRP